MAKSQLSRALLILVVFVVVVVAFGSMKGRTQPFFLTDEGTAACCSCMNCVCPAGSVRCATTATATQTATTTPSVCNCPNMPADCVSTTTMSGACLCPVCAATTTWMTVSNGYTVTQPSSWLGTFTIWNNGYYLVYQNPNVNNQNYFYSLEFSGSPPDYASGTQVVVTGTLGSIVNPICLSNGCNSGTIAVSSITVISQTATTSVACTNTVTIAVTAGQGYPPLNLPPPGSCYKIVSVGSGYSVTTTCPLGAECPVATAESQTASGLLPVQGAGFPSAPTGLGDVPRFLGELWGWIQCQLSGGNQCPSSS